MKQWSHVPAVADPYAYLASNIPANPCKSYPKNPSPLKGTYNWPSGNTVLCGDQQLTGNVTINTPAAGAVLVIENGQLDANGYTLQTSNGSALTIVFSGDNGKNYLHAPASSNGNKGGVLDFNSPISGSPWKGVAIY